ncbi:MAG: YbgC/FadM family acyl-CoA thioesterase [Geobacter sp.]|jgi:acyl-CoA thioester hydrolase
MLLRVYYEDTDAAGVVYHSNYLNYCERARTEYLRERGWSVAELASDGAVFPVVRMEIDFKAPARHDDLLQVITTPLRVGGSSFELRQRVHRASDGKLLVELLVTLACVTPQLKARRIPAGVRATLSAEVSAA